MSQLFAGIDWGGAHHQVAVVDPEGREVWNRRFVHDREGIDELIGSLTCLDDLVGVAIERSEGDGGHVRLLVDGH